MQLGAAGNCKKLKAHMRYAPVKVRYPEGCEAKVRAFFAPAEGGPQLIPEVSRSRLIDLVALFQHLGSRGPFGFGPSFFAAPEPSGPGMEVQGQSRHLTAQERNLNLDPLKSSTHVIPHPSLY